MKPKTVFLGEMTNPEIEAHLAAAGTNPVVLIPIGSTEQHGPHGPLLTDTFIPTEVCRRVAGEIGALVAPSVPYGLSYPHKGFTGVVYLRMSTFAALIEDLCAQFATMGFKRIVFVNGHYDNTYAIAYACASAGESLPMGARAYVINYWDGMPPEVAAQFMSMEQGLHANKAEVSGVMAINPDYVDMAHATAEMPPFPEVGNVGAVHTAFFFSSPGSVYRATRSGAWGDARESSAEFGEQYLAAVTAGTVRLLDDIERTQAAMPDR
ncbi:MAG TPA: creatininase family protein [Candidatus Limnocylindrales bacterium]